MMTSHELAKQLLAGPDLPVYVFNEDGWRPEPVEKAEVTTFGDLRHTHTNEPTSEDNAGNDLPQQYVMVWGKS